MGCVQAVEAAQGCYAVLNHEVILEASPAEEFQGAQEEGLSIRAGEGCEGRDVGEVQESTDERCEGVGVCRQQGLLQGGEDMGGEMQGRNLATWEMDWLHPSGLPFWGRH